mmetsp:Transcript_6353/g.20056  ORF Transcript_6353/g.20056 Transcript_6353/m.20056 type:complete len:822 (-) Transcript_6353:111-2576(-)
MAAVRALFDGFLSKLDSLDPSKTLSGMRLPSLTGSVSKKTSSSEDPAVDTDASTSFHDVVVEARHRPEAIVGEVTVEVLAAGGWSRAGLGDTFSSEDSFALLVLDGGVARTSAVKDSKAPVWAASDRRAFRFAIADPSATLFVALFDEDPDPLSTDDPIGRCALAPRSLAPGATYDAWFPLSLKANEGESVATATRALVAKEALATAAAANDLQKASRGAARLRVRVTWSDGGTAAARSAATDLFGGGPDRYVALPNDKSGRVLRENCRFAMYGEGGCPTNPSNEPFSTTRLGDHFGELTRLVGAAATRYKVRLVALVAYVRPLRSLLALAAWCTSCAAPARVPGWLALFAFLDLRDALCGERLPKDTSLGQVPPTRPRKPAVARPQLTFGSWCKAAAGLSASSVAADDDNADADVYARGLARGIATEVALDKIRAKRVAPRTEVEVDEDEDEDDDDDVGDGPGKCMKSYSSMNPLAPFLRPVQHGLLGLVKFLRAVGGLFDGRDDPVATATLAAVCLWMSACCFVYSELLHGCLFWFVAWVQTIVAYSVGILLFGPQNYFLAERARRADATKRAALAAAAFDDKHLAAVKLQGWRKRCVAKVTDAKAAAERTEADAAAAAEAKEAEAEEAEAEAERRAEVAKRRTEAVAAADAKAVEQLAERLAAGAVVATRDEGSLSFGAAPPCELSLSDDHSKFLFQAKGSSKEKKIKLVKIHGVKPIDPRKPKVLKFSTESKSFKFEFTDAADCALFVRALRALAPEDTALASKKLKKKDFLRLAVPSKPVGGFLASSLSERDPAWPEAHRSRVVVDDVATPKDKTA